MKPGRDQAAIFLERDKEYVNITITLTKFSPTY